MLLRHGFQFFHSGRIRLKGWGCNRALCGPLRGKLLSVAVQSHVIPGRLLTDVVDPGSLVTAYFSVADACGEICDRFAEKDARVRVFHTENRGLSAARNLAIRNAAGDYLMFVDGDDWVHEDFCKAAYECAQQHHADLVMFNYVHVRKGEKGDASQRKAFRS
ncbi:MAG: glycosyltransferase family 2 protein, partial [Oscillospiraceae bacterium]|nr:glycosyltransferase family 2 protein [Oscillospiraceae bacterium]